MGASGRQVLRGRVVLITGPARGIGAATARQLSRRGARVALVGLEPERLEGLAGELGPEAAWFLADVRDAAALEAAVAGTVDRFGAIDAVVANAGVTPVGTVVEIAPEDFEAGVHVDLLGVWRTVWTALPHVIQRRGYILAVSSLAAMVHLPLMSSYAASKAGVHAFCDALRMEMEPVGVAVGVAYFSFVDTDMTRAALSVPAAQAATARIPAAARRAMPVSVAAAAVVAAIERRARWVVRPRSAYPLLFVPTLFQGLAEAAARRAGIGLDPAWQDYGAATPGPASPRLPWRGR